MAVMLTVKFQVGESIRRLGQDIKHPLTTLPKIFMTNF